jgi:hypothetical protein
MVIVNNELIQYPNSVYIVLVFFWLNINKASLLLFNGCKKISISGDLWGGMDSDKILIILRVIFKKYSHNLVQQKDLQ